MGTGVRTFWKVTHYCRQLPECFTIPVARLLLIRAARAKLDDASNDSYLSGAILWGILALFKKRNADFSAPLREKPAFS
jgi:hypothetical protein